jgi:hypothetical protein
MSDVIRDAKDMTSIARDSAKLPEGKPGKGGKPDERDDSDD